MKADYPSVLLIYTGGTIGMIENPETGALENFNFDHLLKHVPELKDSIIVSLLTSLIPPSTPRIWNRHFGPNWLK
ncbi:MAG: asparaginase domain-containing protein [Parabacteroides distasonis]